MAEQNIFTKRFRKKVTENGGVTAVAKLTGISRTTINYWFQGTRSPDMDNLMVLCDKLNVSADYLLGRVEEFNATDDEMVRHITEYTGLSNRTIEKLHRYYNNGVPDTFFLGDDEEQFMRENPLDGADNPDIDIHRLYRVVFSTMYCNGLSVVDGVDFAFEKDDEDIFQHLAYLAYHRPDDWKLTMNQYGVGYPQVTPYNSTHAYFIFKRINELIDEAIEVGSDKDPEAPMEEAENNGDN